MIFDREDHLQYLTIKRANQMTIHVLRLEEGIDMLKAS